MLRTWEDWILRWIYWKSILLLMVEQVPLVLMLGVYCIHLTSLAPPWYEQHPPCNLGRCCPKSGPRSSQIWLVATRFAKYNRHFLLYIRFCNICYVVNVSTFTSLGVMPMADSCVREHLHRQMLQRMNICYSIPLFPGVANIMHIYMYVFAVGLNTW